MNTQKMASAKKHIDITTNRIKEIAFKLRIMIFSKAIMHQPATSKTTTTTAAAYMAFTVAKHKS
jgi:hypothetical protein